MFIFTKKPVHIINYLYALFLNPLLSGYPSCSHTHTHTYKVSFRIKGRLSLWTQPTLWLYGPRGIKPNVHSREHGASWASRTGSKFTHQLWCCTLKQHPHSTRAINLTSDWHV